MEQAVGREEVTVDETAPESPITPEEPEAVVQEAVVADEVMEEAAMTEEVTEAETGIRVTSQRIT